MKDKKKTKIKKVAEKTDILCDSNVTINMRI